MRSFRLLALVLAPLLAFVGARQADGPALVPLAGSDGTAELDFEIRERGGGRIPARLTFVPREGGSAVLFTNPAAAPHELAARADVVYTRSGAGRITVPPGSYTIHASRGLEWSLATRAVELRADERTRLELELVHELETPGWIGADFHLHTLTHSGHGDASLEERLLSCLGEGLDLAVATDHDHHTDYHPTLSALGLEGRLATLTGNEVSTPIGHFNAFPLDPARAPVDSNLEDANELFRLLRAERDPAGVTPVIQLNHPRLAEIDYFGHTALDPVTGRSADPRHSRAFDALEILNGNHGTGYRDPFESGSSADPNRHSVLTDWFHLLDQGERPAAVGNSDSHHVRAIVAGFPRNFVRVASDDPARVRPAELAAAVRAKQLFTTTGPFVELELAGVPMGGEARATGGHAELEVRVRAASWVDCDRVKVFANGDLAARLTVAPGRAPERLAGGLELCFLGVCERHGRARSAAPGAFDAWVVVVVEGDDPLLPVLDAEARPLAIANPVWVDGDGDGRWTSPRERIAAELRAQPTPALAREWYDRLLPAEQALALEFAPRGPVAAVLLDAGLAADARAVRLAAARAAERHVIPGTNAAVQRAWSANRDDAFLAALLLRALVSARPEQGPARLLAYEQRFGRDALRAQAREILPLFTGGDVTDWQVMGPLAGPPALAAGPPPAGAASEPGWQLLEPARAARYVDLRDLGGTPTEHSRAYAQTWLRAPEARTVPCCFGSDDGARVWLNEKLLYENRAAKTADPLEKLLALELQPGWNRLVLEIANETGGFGFYCRLLDPEVEAALQPH